MSVDQNASPICRGKNLTMETVFSFVNAMPKKVMSKAEFNRIAESHLEGWTQTHSQIARQIAFYYEKDDMCYPRFTTSVSCVSILSYMKNWATKYFIPNIYTPSLHDRKTVNIYAFLKSQIANGQTNFDEACKNIYGIKLNNTDKVRVYLTNFTDLVVDKDKKMYVNEGVCEISAENVHPIVSATNAENYFHYFDVALDGVDKMSSGTFDSREPLQQIFFGAPGTGKSHKIDCDLFKDANGNPLGIGLKSISQEQKFRTTFHPDYDYAQFVGSYKPKSVCDTSSVGIQDPGNLSIDDLIDIAKKMHDDEIAHPYARLGTLYYKSLNALSKSVVGAKKEICDKSGNGMDNGPELNTGIFIGEYLEENIVSKETKIIYSFVPQVFAKAYVAAWERILNNGIPENEKSVYLVIEEINRGNCAQIFGDIFQLLDRKDGHSEYPIDVDSDFATYIRETLGDKFAAYKEMICSYCKDAATENATPDEKFCKIALPSNFNILATMNTSDQSLFPMDSAFKRRFDWEYVPIKYFKDSKCGESWNADKFEIKLDDNTSFSWLHFLKKINADIYKVTESEDKQMGEFFVKPKNNVIDLDMFRSKVLFYLWDSVYKDAVDDEHKNVFHFHFKTVKYNIEDVTFQHLFGDDARAIGIINAMMTNLDDKYDSKNNPEFKDFLIIESAESQDTQGSNQ